MAQHPSVIPLLQASDAVERSDLSARTTLRSKPESPSNKFAAWNAAKAIWAFLLLARVDRVLEKDLDWFVSKVRTLQEHTEGLWRKNAKVTRAYPANFRFPA
jgi:hypothetical protein